VYFTLLSVLHLHKVADMPACCLVVLRCATALVPQALFASDPGQLRSLSKGESHFGSFNRHFPVARCSSKTQEVHQVRETDA
jgi:hypothetical protein